MWAEALNGAVLANADDRGVAYSIGYIFGVPVAIGIPVADRVGDHPPQQPERGGVPTVSRRSSAGLVPVEARQDSLKLGVARLGEHDDEVTPAPGNAHVDWHALRTALDEVGYAGTCASSRSRPTTRRARPPHRVWRSCEGTQDAIATTLGSAHRSKVFAVQRTVDERGG
jgi:hypothetical protein